MTTVELAVRTVAGIRAPNKTNTWRLAAPVSLALEMPLDGGAPRWFGAPPAHSWPNRVGDFSGSVATGASCNCRNLQLTPHGSGTHTECVGHLTIDDYHAIRIIPKGLLPALLVKVSARSAREMRESADFPPEPGDFVITAHELDSAWPASPPFEPAALIIASGTPAAGSTPTAERGVPPYLTKECAERLVARGIKHLVVELPSIDRQHDAGRLTAHRIFFGLPPHRTQVRAPLARDAVRADATITELACVPATLPAGFGFLQLQAPALQGDAVPSQPLWFALVATDS